MLEVQRVDDEPVSLYIGQQEFEVEEETGYVTGDTELSRYVAALRQAVNERDQAAERDFDDEGDYIFLHYDIRIESDFEIQEATQWVDAAIQRIHQRADQLVTRKRDELLGIFDRGSFESDLTHALTGRLPVALVMVDIDHFKQVNDAFGHPVGDEVLRAVAKVLTSKCDGRNRVEYRHGGEELALILTGDDVARATEVAESVRVDVGELRFDAYRDLRVTVSVGVGEVPREGSNSTELVRLADAACTVPKPKGVTG